MNTAYLIAVRRDRYLRPKLIIDIIDTFKSPVLAARALSQLVMEIYHRRRPRFRGPRPLIPVHDYRVVDEAQLKYLQAAAKASVTRRRRQGAKKAAITRARNRSFNNLPW